jgi:hypothetical protein
MGRRLRGSWRVPGCTRPRAGWEGRGQIGTSLLQQSRPQVEHDLFQLEVRATGTQLTPYIEKYEHVVYWEAGD